MEQVGAVEVGGAAFDASRGLWDEAQHRHAGDGFAGAGLADDAQRLALLKLERHAIHRPHHAVARVEVGRKIVDVEQWHFQWFNLLRSWGRGRRGGRRRRS